MGRLSGKRESRVQFPQRTVALVLLVALLALPGVVRWVAADQEAERSDSAEGEAALVLRVITPHPRIVRQAFASGFEAWHRRQHGSRVQVQYLVPGGTNDVVRYLKELYSARPEGDESVGVDVVWGGGDYTFEHELKQYLRPLDLTPGLLKSAFPERELGGVALLDPESDEAPRWVGVVLSSFGIVSSPAFMNRIGLPVPARWRDLTAPQLKGLLALADPTRSGSAAMVYMVVLQREMASAVELASEAGRGEAEPQTDRERALDAGFLEGIRVLTAMAANARYFTDSSPRPCEDVASADAAAGIAIDFYARAFQQAVGDTRLAYRAPVGATAITPDPVAILEGTRGVRWTVASRFVEYLLSEEGQRLWALPASASVHLSQSLRRLPIRADVYSRQGDFVDRGSPFEMAQGFNVRGEWMGMFSALRVLWAAAYIDAGPELRSAYGRLGSGSPYLRRLWSLPLSRSRVLAFARELREDRAFPDKDLRRASRRQHWAAIFRAHYLAVAKEGE